MVIHDPSIQREVLELLSDQCDLVLMRQVPVSSAGNLDLLLLDASALAAAQKGYGFSNWCGPPILAIFHAVHLSPAGSTACLDEIDDFLVMPFTVAELLLRVRAVIRRGGRQSPGALSRGDFYIDGRRGEVYQAGRPLPLTRKEASLLHALARRAGQTVTRAELLDEVWGTDYVGSSNVLDVHIRSLRRKVEPDPARPQFILTVRGIGYRFILAVTPARPLS